MSRPKRPRDANQLAKMIVDIATGEKADPPKPVIGRKGGEARATKLAPKERSRIAKKAAAARWERTKDPQHNP